MSYMILIIWSGSKKMSYFVKRDSTSSTTLREYTVWLDTCFAVDGYIVCWYEKREFVGGLKPSLRTFYA